MGLVTQIGLGRSKSEYLPRKTNRLPGYVSPSACDRPYDRLCHIRHKSTLFQRLFFAYISHIEYFLEIYPNLYTRQNECNEDKDSTVMLPKCKVLHF